MTATDFQQAAFPQAIQELNALLQKILFRSNELLAQLGPARPEVAEAEKLHAELQRAIILVRQLVVPERLPVQGPGSKSATSPASPKATLLYVDDKPERLELLRSVLESKGYDVITAHDGRDGLRTFVSHKIKLVILDYYMPSMNGGAVAIEMRNLRPDVPIIIFSGALTLPDRVMAAIDGFISTSEEPELLLQKIAELLPAPHSKAS